MSCCKQRRFRFGAGARLELLITLETALVAYLYLQSVAYFT